MLIGKNIDFIFGTYHYFSRCYYFVFIVITLENIIKIICPAAKGSQTTKISTPENNVNKTVSVHQSVHAFLISCIGDVCGTRSCIVSMGIKAIFSWIRVVHIVFKTTPARKRNHTLASQWVLVDVAEPWDDLIIIEELSNGCRWFAPFCRNHGFDETRDVCFLVDISALLNANYILSKSYEMYCYYYILWNDKCF